VKCGTSGAILGKKPKKKMDKPRFVLDSTVVILNATLLSCDPHHLKKPLWPGLTARRII
jgi:hypothetical protein